MNYFYHSPDEVLDAPIDPMLFIGFVVAIRTTDDGVLCFIDHNNEPVWSLKRAAVFLQKGDAEPLRKRWSGAQIMPTSELRNYNKV